MRPRRLAEENNISMPRMMIALDTSVLVRYLVDDDPQQAEAVRALLAELTFERLGFICRDVSMELAWIPGWAYEFSRNRIATVFEELAATKEIHLEAANDVIRAADNCRRGGADFTDRMIAVSAKRSGADALYTFDRQDDRPRATSILSAAHP